MNTIYKEYSGGRWNYRIWSFDEQRYYPISKETAMRMLDDGDARLVTVE